MFKKGSKFVKMFNNAILENRYRIAMIKKKYLENDMYPKCSPHPHKPVPLSKFLKAEFTVFLLCTADFLNYGIKGAEKIQ